MTDSSRDQRLDKLRESANDWLGSGDLAVGAMVEAAFLMAAADGELSSLEQEQLVATIEHVMPSFERERIQGMVDSLLGSLETDGWEVRIASVAGNLPDATARRNAYRLAAGVSFVDGEVQESEQRLFGLLAKAFEIPETEASWILTEVRDELYGEPEAKEPA